MIPVESVIQRLVNEFEFVVIPGFGALLSRQVAAYYDKTTGRFSPPSKRLAFNEFIKLDDGLLANYISRHEKISHSDALTYIRLYTEGLKAGLHNHGTADIIGIGSFVFNEEGKLVFEPTSVKYFKDDWFGFHEIEAKMAERPVDGKQTVYQKALEIEYVAEEVDEVKKQSWLTWAAAAMVAGVLCYFSFFLVTSNQGLNKSNLNPFTYFFSKKEVKVKNSVEEVPVAEEKIAEPLIEETTTAAWDSVVTDSVATEQVKEIVAEAPVSALSEETAVDAKYYLIAGAFKGDRQAGILLEEMKKKGYNQAILIPGDEFSKKVKVAVQGFETEADAHAAAAQLKEVIGEKGWVYHKR
ncbi:hypothetical protein DYBT9275_01811 [Dyadobacter sp. CECT 9275]|uniref:SPOR domain-containing protein n=1 Tax=Dyadobacter helix TaxID=2822344 RepID=A0A916J9P2_9BACT|nr:SPOR domain-containing protein [Dyadobacter sp. CECT 9275]CAG4997604.1 hypothetical protein DYBT9275_01811 [Dyadobacter sp. CECT 9275]